VYDALGDLATVAVIKTRLSRDGYDSAEKIQTIRAHRKSGSNADIVPLIAAMQFSLNCDNPSGFADFDTKNDTDLNFDPKHIIEQCTARVLASFEVLYADVYTPSKAPKGVCAYTVPGYPQGIICHNTAHNTDHKGKQGNDSLLTLKGPTADCVKAFYSKTLCNATITTDTVKNKRCCIESGAVKAETLGAGQAFYFPRQAGRFASGVTMNKQVRPDDRGSFMGAVRRWFNNRLMAVYTAYVGLGDVWSISESVRRAAKSLANAFIVTEYEENGVPMLRIRTNMFFIGADQLRALSADNFTVTDITQTKDEDFKVITVTVALQGGIVEDTIKVAELATAQKVELEQQEMDKRAEQIYALISEALTAQGYEVSGLMRTQSSTSKAIVSAPTTHRFDATTGGTTPDNVETKTYTDASSEDIQKALDAFSDI